MIGKEADKPPKVHQPHYYPQIAGKLVKSRCS